MPPRRATPPRKATPPRRAAGEQRSTSPTRRPRYEFFGPVGAALITLGLPCLTLGLYAVCNENGCLDIAHPLHLPAWPSSMALFSWHALGVVVAWIAWQVTSASAPLRRHAPLTTRRCRQAILAIALPGQVAEGVVLANGQHLKYKINGFSAFVVSLAMLAAAEYGGLIRLAWIHDNFVPLATSAILVSFLLSVYLYASALAPGRLLAKGGATGNHVYDFFIGRELNPRIGSFDLKVFCELRPGLIGWVVINIAMALRELENFGSISASMLLVNVFQFLYVADALYSEVRSAGACAPGTLAPAP